MAKAINIKFPLKDDTEKNIFLKQNYTTKDALVSNLLLLLLTEEDERFYMSDFGINLKKYIFQPNDTITQGEITEELRDKVKKFIPQLTITKVQFYSSDVDENDDPLMENEITAVINFNYDFDTFSDEGVVEVTFPA